MTHVLTGRGKFVHRHTGRMPREDAGVKRGEWNHAARSTIHIRVYQELDLTKKETPPELSEGTGLIPKF